MEQQYNQLNAIRRRVLSVSASLVWEKKSEVFEALELIMNLLDLAHAKGIVALERQLVEMEIYGGDNEKFLSEIFSIGLSFKDSVLEEILKRYESRQRTPIDALICYIYLRGLLLLLEGVNKRTREQMLLSLIPEGERYVYLYMRRRRN